MEIRFALFQRVYVSTTDQITLNIIENFIQERLLSSGVEEFFDDYSKIWGVLFRRADKFLYREGQFLFYQSHYPTGVYILFEGDVGFYRMINGKRVFQTQMPVGIPLGIDLIQTNSPYEFDAEARSTASGIYLPRRYFLDSPMETTKS